MRDAPTWLWLPVARVIAVILWALCTSIVSAQPLADDGEAKVELNLPGEIGVQGLVDYTAKRLNIRIIYGDEIKSLKVHIRAPGEVPASSLLGLLQSVLRMHNLALVDTDVDGWKRIVAVDKLPEFATRGQAEPIIQEQGRGTPITQVFQLKSADAEQVDRLIKPFLSKTSAASANSLAVRELGLLIVTDFASNMSRIEEVITLIDPSKPNLVLEFVPIKNAEAAPIAQKVNAVLAAQQNALTGKTWSDTGTPTAPPGTVQVTADERTNQLLVIGIRSDVEEVLQLIQSLDVPLGLTTEVYQFQYVSPARVDRLVKEMMDPLEAKRLYRSSVDEREGYLVVTATPEIQRQIVDLKQRLDNAAPLKQSPIRFYKLNNVSVLEVLDTLRAFEQDSAPTPALRDGRFRMREGQRVPGPNRVPGGPGEFAPLPPTVQGIDEQMLQQLGDEDARSPSATASTSGAPATVQPAGLLEQSSPASQDLLTGSARVTADVNTNTLIVVGDSTVQQVYAELIQKLDFRRPQVLIDVKIVTVDTGHNYSLGVEVSGGDRSGAKRLLAFSSYGLSSVNPVSGALSIIPGLGFNGTLVDPDTADVVLRALATHRRARVESAPRILVNDNAEGLLTSVAEVPFATNNQTLQTSSTTFAGFAEAGTTVRVVPHIGEGDHLQLEFDVVLNDFTGAATANLPPPRQTNEVSSEVTVPDGHTIIVGGLKVNRLTEDFQGIPFLEYVPVLRLIDGNETKATTEASLFVFIRPIILRDDKFSDLKYLSEHSGHQAGTPSDYPHSGPVLIR